MPISGQNTIFPPFFNGDGNDGVLIGVNNPPGTYEAAASKMYESVSLKPDTSYDTNSHLLFVRGLLRISSGSSLNNDGGAASTKNPGAGATGTGRIAGAGDGGTPRTATDPISPGSSVTIAGLGGNGGTAPNAPLSPGESVWYPGFEPQNLVLRNFQTMYSKVITHFDVESGGGKAWSFIFSGGGGGAMGQSDTPDASNYGGAGGGGGGVLWVAADTIWIESGGLITANGGNGGDATTATNILASGGGGGGAGAVILFCNHFICDNGGYIKASGGGGGNGVEGGGNGSPGNDGNIVVFTPQEIIVTTGTYPQVA